MGKHYVVADRNDIADRNDAESDTSDELLIARMEKDLWLNCPDAWVQYAAESYPFSAGEVA